MDRLESETKKRWMTSFLWLLIVITLVIAGLGFLGVKDQTIALREERIQKVKAENENLYQALRVLESNIMSLARSLGALEGRIGSLEQALKDKEGRVGSLARSLGALEGRIGSLEQALKDKANKEDNIGGRPQPSPRGRGVEND